eukprot:Tamp_23376.p1 GENE.Tamp_23376~~Tamp_23376.p1  ORF type:complete len:154 (+),score=29.74 Tamp_23376:467-928(+)
MNARYEFNEREGKKMVWEKFDETLAFLDRVFLQHGPFDGILGFSQGACVAGVLCALLDKDELPANIKFDFAVLISGFQPLDSVYSSLYPLGKKIEGVRTMHVIGNADQIIPPLRSEQLAEKFEWSTVVRHEKGHMVPSDKAVREAVKAFIFKD